MKRIITFLIFGVVYTGLTSDAAAQYEVRGTIVDQQTGDPIPGANVLIVGTGTNATTDDNGNFFISSATDFDKISIVRIGYVKRDVAVTDKSKALHIELVPSSVQMTGIQVLGSAQLDRAQSIGELTPRDLGRANGISLENSINTIPGIFMQSRTPWGGQRISIRGYYPNFSQNSNGYGYQLFLNNIPITDATGLTIMDDIDFSTLGNVEVIKGPASSAYGSFIAGTVNLKTARPEAGRTTLDEQATGGSYGLFRNNILLQSSGENSDITANYGHQTYKGFRAHTASQKDYVRLTGDFGPNQRQTVSTYLSFNRSYEEIAGELDSADFYNKLAPPQYIYINNDSHIQIESFRAGITNTFRMSDQFSNTTTFFGTGHTMNQPFAHGFNDYNRFSYGARTAFGFQDQCGNLGINGTLGASFQRTNYTNNGVFIVPAPPNPQRYTNQKNYGMNYYLFTEWSITLPAQFIVTVGASLNRNEFGIRNMIPKNNLPNDTTKLQLIAFKPAFTPRISLLKIFNDNVSVYASVSSGYTPPPIANIAANNTVDTLLKPERAVQYEIGTKGNLMDGRFSYQLALFDLENTDKLVTQTINAVNFTVNAGKQRNRGAELSLSFTALDNPDETFSLLRPWASYTYSDFKYVDFKSNNNIAANTVNYSGNQVARVPRNMFSLGIDAGTDFGLYFFGSFQFVDKAPVTFDNLNFVKSYNLLNAKIGYQQPVSDHLSLNLFVGADNLLGSTYYSFLNVSGSINGLSQATGGDGYIIPGPYKATVYGGAKLSYAL